MGLRGADEIIYQPTAELVEESLMPALTANKSKTGTKRRAKKKTTKKKRFAELAALELYDGYDGFLVRTALIRATDYDAKAAPTIRGPEAAAAIADHLKYADQEHMVVLALSARMVLLAIHEVAIGGTSSVQLEMQHLIKVPLLTSARAVIAIHNHPSGLSELSPEDMHLTRKLKEGLQCIGVDLLDSVVVARDGWSSYMEQGGTF